MPNTGEALVTITRAPVAPLGACILMTALMKDPFSADACACWFCVPTRRITPFERTVATAAMLTPVDATTVLDASQPITAPTSACCTVYVRLLTALATAPLIAVLIPLNVRVNCSVPVTPAGRAATNVPPMLAAPVTVAALPAASACRPPQSARYAAIRAALGVWSMPRATLPPMAMTRRLIGLFARSVAGADTTPFGQAAQVATPLVISAALAAVYSTFAVAPALGATVTSEPAGTKCGCDVWFTLTVVVVIFRSFRR